MNTKTILPFLTGLVAFTTLHAEVLSPEQALQRLDNTSLLNTRSTENNPVLKYTLNDSYNQPALYIFANSDSSGFKIVSADDAAIPLLGYSDLESFDADNIPPQMKYWLSEYSRQIEYMRENSFPVYHPTRSMALESMSPIAPLLKSKWNQGAPYNTYCYTIAADGQQTKSVTGCVATSMAQVMYYFKYPDVGTGEISYKHGDSGTYSMNFSQQSFDWNNMLPTYTPAEDYTQTQADAVAYLMKACGYSVRMDYGKGESGASGTAIAGALIDYFKYDDGITVETRKFYTYDDWMTMIYKNLAEVGPLVYNGSAIDGGHSFVCDGYDGNGYFHINWGWGGMSDGYYLLDALNPDEFGIGGAAGGFNLGQQVILGITPQKSENVARKVMQFGNTQGKIENKTLTLELVGGEDPEFQYIDPLPVEITFGIEIVNESNANQAVQYVESSKKNLAAKQGSSFKWSEVGTSVNLDNIDMTEGDKYDFIMATQINISGSSQWNETVAMPGKSNMVTIVKTDSGYQITNYSPGELAVSDFKVLSSPVYAKLPIKFSATFTNNSDSQLTRNYSAQLFNSDGDLCFKTENYSITVDANSTINDTWTSVQWYNVNDYPEITQATEFSLKLYDMWEGNYVEGIDQTVTVLPAPKDSKLEASMSVVGATKEDDVFVVNSTDFEVSITIKVTEGFFNGTVMLGMQEPLSDGSYYEFEHQHFDAIPDLSEGQQQTLTMSMTLDDAKPDTIYRLVASSNRGGLNEIIKIRFDLDNNAVATIAADQNGMYQVFNLSGIKVLTTKNIDELQNLPSGIYIVNGKKMIF